MMKLSRLRPLVIALAILPSLALSAGADIDASAEADTYRFGGTYARMMSESPAVCAALCSEDARCVAWSQLPKMLDAEGMCELKQTFGRAEIRPGHASGLAGFHEVGALRDDVGSVPLEPVRAARRGDPALRPSSPQAGYQPVSAGLEVNELLGGKATAMAASQQDYAPRLVIGALIGKVTSTSATYSTALNTSGPSFTTNGKDIYVDEEDEEYFDE